ncbi:hypothetical protein ACFL0M_13925 [Thermodesulfobacteriota bacterium]
MSFFSLNGLKPFIKRAILQISLLLVLTTICLTVFLIAGDILKLPFRSANDALHQKNTSFTLDFLIPGGTYIDEKITIGEVIKIRVRKETSLYENVIRSVANLIPVRYRYGADIILFLFWTFLFMIFFRVFTFTGYGRALRTSLFLSGLVYFFLPDFSPGKIDDAIFITFPCLIIFLRIYVSRRKKKTSQEKV